MRPNGDRIIGAVAHAMDNAIIAGLSKQIVLARALDVTANNIANQTTAGFKAERVEFREVLAAIEHSTSGDPSISLVIDRDSYTDFAPGGVEATYNQFDFAIDGPGFFAVDAGAGLQYTRDGRFSSNMFGELTTRSGARVLDASGAPILLDPEGGPVSVSADGDIQQDGAPVARLGVFLFDDEQSLRRLGDNRFESDETPNAAVAPVIRQGFIETSNVAPITAVTDMIEIMRAYQQAATAVETADNLARETISRLSRIS